MAKLGRGLQGGVVPLPPYVSATVISFRSQTGQVLEITMHGRNLEIIASKMRFPWFCFE